MLLFSLCLIACAGVDAASVTIQPWDVVYFSRQASVQPDLTSFFTLRRVLDGLQLIVKQVFGVSTIIETVPAAASWAGTVQRCVVFCGFCFPLGGG